MAGPGFQRGQEDGGLAPALGSRQGNWVPRAAPKGVGRLPIEAVTSEGDPREGEGNTSCLPSWSTSLWGRRPLASSGPTGLARACPRPPALVFSLEQGYCLLLPTLGAGHCSPAGVQAQTQAQGLVCGRYRLGQGQAHFLFEPQPAHSRAGRAGGLGPAGELLRVVPRAP